MAVRNFWVEADIDGYKTKVQGGPRRKEDGMNLTIYQREDGEISTAFQVKCKVTPSGNLITSVFDDEGKLLTSFQTTR